MFAGNFEPLGWAFCNGQLLSISEYDTLFTLIGTTYGGDGMTTFALPDLRGRFPLHPGNGNVIGQAGGGETVTLTSTQMPAHTHAVRARTAIGTQATPTGALAARDAGAGTQIYSTGAPGAALAANTLGIAGGSQPHENMPPFVAIHFIISLFGIFPTQT